jgi:hypothetical protein
VCVLGETAASRLHAGLYGRRKERRKKKEERRERKEERLIRP